VHHPAAAQSTVASRPLLQGILTVEERPGGLKADAVLRVTLLAAGFVIGARAEATLLEGSQPRCLMPTIHQVIIMEEPGVWLFGG
jgi:hypothetical protein